MSEETNDKTATESKSAPNAGSVKSYHDLHITTEAIPRTSISNLPFGVELVCNRVGGWTLWSGKDHQLAGEYGSNWLVLDVAGVVILDSRQNALLSMSERSKR